MKSNKLLIFMFLVGCKKKKQRKHKQLNNIFHQFYLRKRRQENEIGNDIKLIFMALTYGIRTYSVLNKRYLTTNMILDSIIDADATSSRAVSVFRLFSFHSFIHSLTHSIRFDSIRYDTHTHIQ